MKTTTITMMLFLGFLLGSCETTDNTILEEEQLSIDNLEELWTEIQADLPRFVELTEHIGSKATRVEYMIFSYERAFGNERPPNIEFNKNAWESAYNNLLPNLDIAKAIATQNEERKYLGVINVLYSYVLMKMVDYYGDIIFTDLASNRPTLDSGEFIYDEAIRMLNEAIENFNEAGDDLATDYYYNNDFNKWIKLANTLKMEAHLNMRLVDPDAISKFNSIVQSGQFISEINDAFEYRYGSGLITADPIHPNYDKNYARHISDYQSNWLMHKMMELNDPRLRFYFYRQINCTPGATSTNGEFCEPREDRMRCSIQNRPGHYMPYMTFCGLDNGYWGRDHGNEDGIPPDGFFRTAPGIYPIGGKFDGEELTPFELNTGGSGLGITPIMLSSYVEFMRVEVALLNNELNTAKILLESGIRKSIDKVIPFANLDPDANLSVVPTTNDIDSFISNRINEFSNANETDRWNILSEQLFIAHYGNGTAAYNAYRRTGFPNNIQFHVDPNVGPFIRSLYYPSEVVNANPNIDQKPNVAVQVFWDTNPPFPNFPYSN
ncbi:MAG: SusD/RagB family nutrient-binding outer membrane lipoprotein [Flavobacteriaceae bacterium]|nr:SusD/RagB family nutrient-binding outer membrane lipoprotein [Flavobacteriaceae bacterium]